MTTITKEMIEKYIKYPNHCPFCGSSNITASDFDGDQETVECEDCGEEWHEEFKIVNIYN